MASSSRSRGRGCSSQGSCGAPAGAPPADDAHLAPQPSLNPEFVAMPATELVAHLNRHRRTADFADAALVFAARERRLAEAEELVRAGDEHMDMLRDEIRARDAQIRAPGIRALQQSRAADTKARALQQRRAADAKARARHGSGISGRGLKQQVGRGRELATQDFRASKAVRYDAGVDTMPARGEVGDDVPRTRYRALRMRPEPPFPSVGSNTSVDTTFDEGEVGDDLPRTRYRSLRMNASPGFRCRSALQANKGLRPLQFHQKEVIHHGVGFNTGVQTMLAEGKVGDDTPRTRYRSLRMNASPGFRGSAPQAKQPRRRRRNAPYLPSKSAAMEEDSDDGKSSKN